MSPPFFANFLAGVLSSLIAVGLIEAYMLVRTRSRNRHLRNVLSFSGRRCTVVGPALRIRLPGANPDRPDSTELVGMVRDRDVYAISRGLDLCRRVGCEAELISAKDRAQRADSNLLCVGGWFGNDYTDSLLQAYCPGFAIRNRELAETNFDEITYECGGKVFRDSEDIAYGFLVKLAPELTGLSGTIVVTWGHHVVGNGAVVELLATSASIFTPFAKKSFFVAVTINRRIGVQGASRHLTDLTEWAFGSACG